MIIVELQGGLGNQMFQYAFGKSLAIKLDTPLYFDTSCFELENEKSDKMRPYQLDLFNLPIKFAKKNIINQFLNPSKFQRGLNKFRFLKKTYFKEYSFLFDPKVNTQSPSVYFEGYWQSEKYFATSDSIKQAFNFKKSLNYESERLKLEIFQKENSVSIHVRRGDYILSPQNIQLHGTCTIDYYKNAINLIREYVNKSFFYFFSDDPKWVEQNLVSDLTNYTIVKHNQGADSWQDMALMSKCKHHIIANSSFSWWGAWLNPSPNKIVIAPKNWFAKPDLNQQSETLIPGNWIRI